MYSYFSFVFSMVSKKLQLFKISKVMQLLRKSLPPCKNGREKNNKFFDQSFLHPVVFHKRKYQVFRSVFGSCPLQLPDQLRYDCLNLGLEILSILQRIFTCLWKTPIKTLNLLSSVLERLTRLPSVFLKHLEHLSHAILVLLFKLLTGKCWLAPLTFCQTNTVM